jgi:hypothetical protein
MNQCTPIMNFQLRIPQYQIGTTMGLFRANVLQTAVLLRQKTFFARLCPMLPGTNSYAA